MGIFELTTGGAIGMLGAGLAVCLAGAGSARGTGLAGEGFQPIYLPPSSSIFHPLPSLEKLS